MRDIAKLLADFERRNDAAAITGEVRDLVGSVALEFRMRQTVALERIADSLDLLVGDLREQIEEVQS